MEVYNSEKELEVKITKEINSFLNSNYPQGGKYDAFEARERITDEAYRILYEYIPAGYQPMVLVDVSRAGKINVVFEYVKSPIQNKFGAN